MIESKLETKSKMISRIQEFLQHTITFLQKDIWLLDTDIEEEKPNPWRLRGLWFSRIFYLTYRRFQQARCVIRASSLTTVTVISVVPVLAFAFAIGKGFGFHGNLQADLIEPTLGRWLGMENAPELKKAVDQLFLFVENTDLSRLGTLGFITVAYSVLRLLSSVEESFNDLWQIRSARTVARKVSDYLSVVSPIHLLSKIIVSAT